MVEEKYAMKEREEEEAGSIKDAMTRCYLQKLLNCCLNLQTSTDLPVDSVHFARVQEDMLYYLQKLLNYCLNLQTSTDLPVDSAQARRTFSPRREGALAVHAGHSKNTDLPKNGAEMIPGWHADDNRLIMPNSDCHLS